MDHPLQRRFSIGRAEVNNKVKSDPASPSIRIGQNVIRQGDEKCVSRARMMRTNGQGGMLLWVVVASGLGSIAVGAEPMRAEFFERKVRPVLASACLRCHGEQKVSGGLRLDSREAL